MLDPWLGFAITVAVCIVVAIVITAAVSLAVRLVARKKSWPSRLIGYARRPFRADRGASSVIHVAMLICNGALRPRFGDFLQPLSDHRIKS